ncbi:MAG: GNAT family N-acetyltransferase [Anaerolineae bacterium]|nr:GNAT family N-acetyltransferase [Anaerolineae bacterium]
MLIRPMEGRDIPAVASLDRQVFRDPWPESAYVQELYFNTNAHYFVLELLDPAQARTWHTHRRRQSARLIGFVGMRVEGTQGHISTLALRPEWRGQRLGEALLLTAIDQAICDGARMVGLEVRVSNEVALNLYSKWQFVQYSRLHRYYADGEDAYLLHVYLEKDPDYPPRVRTRLLELMADLEIRPVGLGGVPADMGRSAP